MWKPLDENSLTRMLAEAELSMSKGCKGFWDYIKLKPQKWQRPPEGNDGGGFWVVALIGRTCIYYNDIEEGFNVSSYEPFGEIENYYCEQSDLLLTVENLYRKFLKDIQGDA